MSEITTPFPDISSVTADKNSVKIIAPAYASECGELNSFLQYSYHRIQLYEQGFSDFSARVERIAANEAEHLNVLGNLIYRLGAAPVYVAYPPYPANFYAPRSVSYSHIPQKIFIDDIAAESGSVNAYKGMLHRLTNEYVAAVIKRILMDEEEHLAAFKAMLEELNKMTSAK